MRLRRTKKVPAEYRGAVAILESAGFEVASVHNGWMDMRRDDFAISISAYRPRLEFGVTLKCPDGFSISPAQLKQVHGVFERPDYPPDPDEVAGFLASEAETFVQLAPELLQGDMGQQAALEEHQRLWMLRWTREGTEDYSRMLSALEEGRALDDVDKQLLAAVGMTIVPEARGEDGWYNADLWSLKKCAAPRSDVTNSQFKASSLVECDLRGSSFENVDLTDATVVDVALDFSDIFRLAASSVTLTGCSFKSSRLRRCLFEDVTFDTCSFDGAELETVDFVRCRFFGTAIPAGTKVHQGEERAQGDWTRSIFPSVGSTEAPISGPPW